MSDEREKLASRLGFILLSAGCAIGIGNVWRFPYVAGQSGGGLFVLLYLVCLAFIGLPVLVMEFSAGRASRRSIVKLHAALTPERRAWCLHGALGMLGLTVLMMFYTTVAGWMVLYFVKTALGCFSGLDAAGVGAAFDAMLADPIEQLVAMFFVCEFSVAICAAGLQGGLERVTKGMMVALLALIVMLAVHSFFLPGGRAGLSFFLVPDFARAAETGWAHVLANAMNQSFFTLSLGIGSMAIFGSYIGKDRALFGEAIHVTLLDTFVALSAGLIVLPACFAFGVAPGEGPGLVFVTLPNVFNQMVGGRLWGSLFFLFMSFAALTTVLAVFEGILACLRDYTNWSRRKASIVVAIAMPVLSAPCSFTLVALNCEDFIVSDLLLPLGGMAFALYCCHRFGWGWKGFITESNTGKGVKFPSFLRIYCAYVLPLIILAIFLIGLMRRFG